MALPHRAPLALDARVTLWLALCLGIVLRLSALAGAGIEHPDEIFQYLEQAYRLLTGDGVIPWEYRYGMRGGLMPLLLAPPMALGRLLAPALPVWAGPRLLLTLLSLIPIAAAWTIGRRRSPTHAAFAALGIAVAPDLVHFAPHALAEPVAIILLLAGLSMVGATEARVVAIGGALLAAGACVRFHYALPALLLALPALRSKSRGALLRGALAGLAISAAADLAIGTTPMAWIAVNVRENLLAGRAALYGLSPASAYPLAMLQLWGGWIVPWTMLAIVGSRGRWSIAAAALATIGLHMLVGHKEYRFILLGSALISLLAALGTADLLARVHLRRDRWTALAAIGWLAASASILAGGRAAALSPEPTPGQSFFGALRGDTAACAIGLWRVHWSGTTGHAGLGGTLPILIVDEAGSPAAPARAFNRLIAPRGTRLPGFAARDCDGAGACLFARRGGCAPAGGATSINRWLRAHDQ